MGRMYKDPRGWTLKGAVVMSVWVLGSLNLDIVCRVAELPKPGETVSALSVERLPGGKGANQAVAAARSGARVSLIGAVGRDEAGEALLAAMQAAGVATDHVAQLGGHATGQACVWVSQAGENSIVVCGGANLALGATAASGATLEGCRVLLAQLETPVAAIEALFQSPAAAAATKILNAAPALAEGRRLFPMADILVVNETELASYAGTPAPAEDLEAVAAAARRLIARDRQTVVVTLGKAGAAAVDAAGWRRALGRPAAAIDTTGAGDCFCGVLAARLDDGLDLPAALAWANAAASLSTEKPGAAPSMPSLEEIAAALEF